MSAMGILRQLRHRSVVRGSRELPFWLASSQRYTADSVYAGKELAERVGFEPTLPFRVNTLSKRAPSATRPSLRRESVGGTNLTEVSHSPANPGDRASLYVLFNSMGEVVETAT